MSITLGSNIASLKSQRQLFNTGKQLSSVFERLSSGQRINKASDDAAGLAIADSLRLDSRVFNQGVRNLNDGISLLTIADAAIENLQTIVVRLEELATQAANGVYSNQQRKALDGEAQALSDEFLRISQSSEFNGQRLLTGEVESFAFQGGIGDDAVINTSVGGAIGTGSFQSASSFATETNRSNDLELGDINGDGLLDLVTAGHDDSYNGYVTVRLGKGTGNFGAATSFAVGGITPEALELGDLNGDGFLDLVTTGSDGFSSSSTIWLGTGTGNFDAPTSFTTGASIFRALSLDDINGDGLLDLITAGNDALSFNGYATVRLGSGTGSFGEAASFATEGFTSYALNLGDINGDGLLDLVTAGTNGSDGSATVRLGMGTGSFGAATSFTTESLSSNALSLADINGDGLLDLVTAGLADSFDGYATVRLGTGTGSFGAATSFTTESLFSSALSLGDLNGDGLLDLITAGSDVSYDGYATVRLGNGSGSFGAATSFATESRYSEALQLGDINGDGLLDLVTAGLDDSNDGYATVRLGESVSGVAPLLEFSLETLADAKQALPIFQRKRDQLATQRGEIGASQARIEVATNVLNVASENYRGAESRIRDADIANESSKLTRFNILQQAASAVLAQANTQPALAIQLLS